MLELEFDEYDEDLEMSPICHRRVDEWSPESLMSQPGGTYGAISDTDGSSTRLEVPGGGGPPPAELLIFGRRRENR